MKTIKYHTDQGIRSGLLVETGRKYHSLLLLDNPIRIRKVPLSEERYFSELTRNGKPYPVKRAIGKFRKAVKHYHGSLRNVSKPVREVLA